MITSGSISGAFASGCSSMLNPDANTHGVYVVSGGSVLTTAVSVGLAMALGESVPVGGRVMVGAINIWLLAGAGLAVPHAATRIKPISQALPFMVVRIR
jgi:hypothetical protein